jgi:dimethylhistidine N-methyltransferase
MSTSAALRDHRDEALSPFARDVITGLTSQPKRLPPKYFYDHAGAQLFEQITAQPEYYPTRCELEILRDWAPEIARLFPLGSALIEFGSGSTKKVRILLDAAPAIAAYVPVDISVEMLTQEAAELRRDYPGLDVLPVAADFTRHFALPAQVATMPRTGFFPGSTIGNFEPGQAGTFMGHARRMLGARSRMLIGVDLVKDTAVLDAAYNDAAGVTAAFNLNLLARINRELDGDFDLASFRHHAFYDSECRRIEMHLASTKRQNVKVCGHTIEFHAGETIHTENSYKYTRLSFQTMAREFGWDLVAGWTDSEFNFLLQALAADK